VAWFRKAAFDGHPGAQSVMGSIYEQGFGVERSLVDAYVWYSLAAEQAGAAMAFHADIDPRSAAARIKPTFSRLDARNAERLLAKTRAKIRQN
jgi:hypothetical protein